MTLMAFSVKRSNMALFHHLAAGGFACDSSTAKILRARTVFTTPIGDTEIGHMLPACYLLRAERFLFFGYLFGYVGYHPRFNAQNWY